MKKWLYILIILAALYLIAAVAAILILKNYDGKSLNDKILIIPLEGTITIEGDGSDIFNSRGVSSTKTIKLLNEISKDKSVKGIIFEINSPGGTVVASQEIATAIRTLNKSNYAVIREVGASGAYWIASAADKIYANPMSVTGSIGVIGSYLEFSELFKEYGIKYEQLIGGKYKDMGIPYKELSKEEKELLQAKINTIHEYFILNVAQNRNKSIGDIRKVADGQFYLGVEAQQLGLVDELGDTNLAIESIKKEINITDIEAVRHEEKTTFFDLISNKIGYNLGRGIGDSIIKADLNKRIQITA